MSYVLITPLKNEEENLLKLKECVTNQTIKPVAWIIVDSGSEDSTFETATNIFVDYNWVYIIKQTNFLEDGYGHINFAKAINEGYAAVKKICDEKQIKYDYVGKTDATPVLCNDYFETLISKMDIDGRLAITCGIQKIVNHNTQIKIEPLKSIPLSGFNDIRLYKKQFFEEIKGYPLTPSPDSILLIKALKREWEVKVITETSFIKPRLGGSKIGIWSGSKLKGKYMYMLGYHPLLAILNALQVSRKIPPHYQFIPMIIGFLTSALKRDKKIEDIEIKEYYGEKRLKEVLNSLKWSKS